MMLDTTSLNEFEETLRGLIADEKGAARVEIAAKPLGKTIVVLAKWRAKLRARRGDLTVAALGITLSACCALFPWYVVYNPDKFGIWKGLQFAGNDNPRPGVSTDGAGRIGLPFGLPDLNEEGGLDMFPTATTAADANRLTPPIEEQPFPGDEVKYGLVYAANGRAMIADNSGMYVVERGSMLPDNSTVASIEQRGEKWVLVTSTDKVIELSPP